MNHDEDTQNGSILEPRNSQKHRDHVHLCQQPQWVQARRQRTYTSLTWTVFRPRLSLCWIIDQCIIAAQIHSRVSWAVIVIKLQRWHSSQYIFPHVISAYYFRIMNYEWTKTLILHVNVRMCADSPLFSFPFFNLFFSSYHFVGGSFRLTILEYKMQILLTSAIRWCSLFSGEWGHSIPL